jgi:hypothetical protein
MFDACTGFSLLPEVTFVAVRTSKSQPRYQLASRKETGRFRLEKSCVSADLTSENPLF